jgi:hypothetical protein
MPHCRKFRASLVIDKCPNTSLRKCWVVVCSQCVYTVSKRSTRSYVSHTSVKKQTCVRTASRAVCRMWPSDERTLLTSPFLDLLPKIIEVVMLPRQNEIRDKIWTHKHAHEYLLHHRSPFCP